MSYISFKYIESHVQHHRIGALVEFGMETDFTSRVPVVASFMKDIAMHIVAMAPSDVDELLLQSFVKDPDKLVKLRLEEIIESVSEDISIIRFVRWDTDGGDDSSPEPPSGPANVVRLGVA